MADVVSGLVFPAIGQVAAVGAIKLFKEAWTYLSRKLNLDKPKTPKKEDEPGNHCNIVECDWDLGLEGIPVIKIGSMIEWGDEVRQLKHYLGTGKMYYEFIFKEMRKKRPNRSLLKNGLDYITTDISYMASIIVLSRHRVKNRPARVYMLELQENRRFKKQLSYCCEKFHTFCSNALPLRKIVYAQLELCSNRRWVIPDFKPIVLVK